jgi:hypothetical protein
MKRSKTKMPSSPNYIRNIKRETETAIARGEHEKNLERKRARRVLEKEGKVKPNDGKDVDHSKPLSKGGSVSRGNLRAVDASKNRSFARNKDGSIK